MECTKDRLSRRLRGLRAERGLTQTEVGAAVGVDQNTISAYETGKAWPNYEVAWKLCDLYGLTLDELGGREFDPEAVA